MKKPGIVPRRPVGSNGPLLASIVGVRPFPINMMSIFDVCESREDKSSRYFSAWATSSRVTGMEDYVTADWGGIIENSKAYQEAEALIRAEVKKGARRIPPPGREPDDRCMGRSRGGLTTKIHALVDARGLPIALKLTPGQAHDGRSAADMLDTLGGGDVLLADRAYDSDALRLEMAARGAWANIKPMPGRKRRPPFSAFLYRYRNLVERFFSKLKHFRAVATRFEKHSENYLALVKLASAKIWMRFTSW
jgi:transposase